MKLVGLLLILSFSALAYADTYYVRKSVTGSGVSTDAGNKAHDALAAALEGKGHTAAKKSGDAQIVLRANVDKGGAGYKITVERLVRGNRVAANDAETSAADLQSTAQKLAATTLEGSAQAAVAAVAETQSSLSGPTEELAVKRPTTSVTPMASINDTRLKNRWYGALGPAFSNSLPGSNTGTKLSLTLGYNIPYYEKLDFLIFYNNSFNTSNAGAPVSVVGLGATIFSLDRGADISPFARFDLGYGGANKYSDSGPVGAISLGAQFFRTKDILFSLLLRREVVATTATTRDISSFPTIDTLMVGIFF